MVTLEPVGGPLGPPPGRQANVNGRRRLCLANNAASFEFFLGETDSLDVAGRKPLRRWTAR